MKYLWISKILLVSIGLISNEKKIIITFNTVFFHIIYCKTFEILPKHSVQYFMSESFTLN